MKSRIAIALVVGILIGRVFVYPVGITLDTTLPWQYGCHDIGLELQPEFGPFIGVC